MLSSAQTSATNEKRLDLDVLLSAGNAAPFDLIGVPALNYRIYQKCMDESNMEEMQYNAAKSKDKWTNIGIGLLAGFALGMAIKH